MLIINQATDQTGIKTLAANDRTLFSNSFVKYKPVLDVACQRIHLENDHGSIQNYDQDPSSMGTIQMCMHLRYMDGGATKYNKKQESMVVPDKVTVVCTGVEGIYYPSLHLVVCKCGY
ncbi:putative [histone H3]-lysine(4) N-trimethyltransferase [Helianthus anomalus]